MGGKRMDKEALYDLLDMESGEDFQYFENMAELLESDEDIDEDVLYELLEDIDLEAFAELAENYFDQLEEAVSDEETEFYTLVENIKRIISGLAVDASAEDDSSSRSDMLVRLASEIVKFRSWYNETENVECENTDTGDTQMLPVRDALILDRAEKLGGPAYQLNFDRAAEYDLDDYVMTFTDMTGR